MFHALYSIHNHGDSQSVRRSNRLGIHVSFFITPPKAYQYHQDVSGTVGATTLTTAQMPRHAHQQSFSNGWGEGADGSIRMHVSSGPGSTSTQPAGQGQSHSHSLATDTDAASNMPPYYALALIMRIA